MESQEFYVYRESDREVLAALKRIREDTQGAAGGHVNIYVANGVKVIDGSVNDIATKAPLPQILSIESAVIYRFHLSLENSTELSVYREPKQTYDRCVATYPGDDPLLSARLLGSARKHLRSFDSTDKFLELIGADNAAYLAKRDENLRKLEELVQSQIERLAEYSSQVDTRALAAQEALAKKAMADRAQLQEEFDAKAAELTDRERALTEEKKKLDDNTSKFTRREIYRRLQETLKERANLSPVSKDTEGKRKFLHALFNLLILIPGIVFVRSLWEAASLVSWSGNVLDWARLVRLPIAGIALAAAVIFYIRWNDDWVRRRANEEFRLKRLDLDLSRASWLVEMALEWKDEKATSLPPELINPLTRNLFPADEAEDGGVRHPAQDLASKLLGASTELNVNIPGVGGAKLDSKAVRRFNKDTDG